MKRKIEIKYEWWAVGKEHPDHDHQDNLAEHAEERIYDQLKENWMSGELNATITDENDNEYSYKGWWEVTVVCNDN